MLEIVETSVLPLNMLGVSRALMEFHAVGSEDHQIDRFIPRMWAWVLTCGIANRVSWHFVVAGRSKQVHRRGVGCRERSLSVAQEKSERFRSSFHGACPRLLSRMPIASDWSKNLTTFVQEWNQKSNTGREGDRYLGDNPLTAAASTANRFTGPTPPSVSSSGLKRFTSGNTKTTHYGSAVG